MLTLQYVPYSRIENLSTHQRIDKLINLISENKIILLEGRLKKNEEASLIRKTMELIAESDTNVFKGIELSTIDPTSSANDKKVFSVIKSHIMNWLLGDRQGMTIVGPASIVKEIKQDPDKIELFIGNMNSEENTLDLDSTHKDIKKTNISKKKSSNTTRKKRNSSKKR